jgi:hypothetical protein
VRQKHLRAARPTENASETLAGRQANGKFTLSSRFALFFIQVHKPLLIKGVTRYPILSELNIIFCFFVFVRAVALLLIVLAELLGYLL